VRDDLRHAPDTHNQPVNTSTTPSSLVTALSPCEARYGLRLRGGAAHSPWHAPRRCLLAHLHHRPFPTSVFIGALHLQVSLTCCPCTSPPFVTPHQSSRCRADCTSRFQARGERLPGQALHLQDSAALPGRNKWWPHNGPEHQPPVEPITVGRPVTRPPPYRSRRAELPHRAPRSYSLRT